MHETTDKGHGRLEIRRIWASDELNEHLTFPHVGQVVRIERTTSRLDGSPLGGGRPTVEETFAVTSLTQDRASPSRLLELNRGHWAIENKLHWVRDVTFDEDRSQVRGKTAHAMASVRNLAISVLRLARATNLVASLRFCSSHLSDLLRLLGFPLPS
jgi:hypothetical protein